MVDARTSGHRVLAKTKRTDSRTVFGRNKKGVTLFSIPPRASTHVRDIKGAREQLLGPAQAHLTPRLAPRQCEVVSERRQPAFLAICALARVSSESVQISPLHLRRPSAVCHRLSLSSPTTLTISCKPAFQAHLHSIQRHL